MNRIILCIYDRFRKSPAIAWGLFLSMTILLLAALFTLGYKGYMVVPFSLIMLFFLPTRGVRR